MDRTITDAPQNKPGLLELSTHAIRNTVGSVTASVGSAVSGGSEELEGSAVPQVADVTSRDAFQQVKHFNTKANMHTARIDFAAGIVERFAGLFWSAIGTATGVIVGLALSSGAVTIPALTIPVVGTMLAGGLGLTALAFGISQFAIRERSNKFMDVADFQLQRNTHMVGQEIAKHIEPSQGHEPARSDGKSWTQMLSEQTNAQERSH